MSIPEFTALKTSLVGFSVKTEEQLLSKLSANDFSGMYGDFIFLVEAVSGGRHLTIMLTSAVNANPYFYSIEAGRIIHGKNIFSVFSSMQAKEWNWNHATLYCVNNFDHSIDGQSLNADIKRVPPGTALIHYAGEAKEVLISLTGNFDFNVKNFSDVFDEYQNISGDYFDSNNNYILSLSAGLDSRLLLASLLAKGIKPVTATMGHSAATDVKVSVKIAKELGLEHSIISLAEEDYLDDATAREIIYATSGTKTFAHWHTYIYIKKLGLPGDFTHLAGSNGEAARSYYFNKGILAKILQHVELGTFRKFFELKLKKGDGHVLANIKDRVSVPAMLDMIEACCKKPHNTADKLDWLSPMVWRFTASGFLPCRPFLMNVLCGLHFR